MTKTKKLAALLAAICTAAALFSGCGATDKIISELIDGNSAAANELYLNKIEANARQEEQFSKAYRARLEEIYNDINSGKLSPEEASGLLDNLRSFLFDFDYEDLTQKIADLISSKNAMTLAEQHMADGGYLSAICAYDRVEADDTNYETAQKRRAEARAAFVNGALDTAQSYANSGDYANAAATLADARSAMESAEGVEYTGEFDARYTEFHQAEIDAAVAETIRAATSLMDKGDPHGAFTMYEGGLKKWPGDSTLTEAYQDAQRSYANAVLDDAAERFTSAQNYAGAMSIIEAAESEIGDETISALLQRAYDYYKGFEPVHLGNLDTFYDDAVRWQQADESYATDNLGTRYEFVYWHNNSQDSYAVYNVSSYDRFTCTLIVSKFYADFTNCGVLELYLDDTLVYRSPQMGMGSYPIDIDIPLNGAVEFKVCYTGMVQDSSQYYSTGKFFLADAYLSRSADGAEPFTERA